LEVSFRELQQVFWATEQFAETDLLQAGPATAA
jgi:hypothetical protein